MNAGLTLSDQASAVSDALRELLKPKDKKKDDYFYVRTWVYVDTVIYQEEGSALFKQRSWSWGANGEVVIGKDETEVAQVWVDTNATAQNAQINAAIRGMVGRKR